MGQMFPADYLSAQPLGGSLEMETAEVNRVKVPGTSPQNPLWSS